MKLDYFELVKNLAKFWDDNHAKISDMRTNQEINAMLSFLSGITACMQVINKMVSEMESEEDETNK